MSILFEKTRRYPDNTVRCYLTLKCNSMCSFCSAQIPQVTAQRREVELPAKIWAEGLNRRKRATILAGGEPFLYSNFAELITLLKPGYKVEIYTNLQCHIADFVDASVYSNRRFQMLVSLHPGTDLDAWLERVKILTAQGHSLRFHIVRSPGFEELAEFLKTSGIVGKYQTALQGDQRYGPKSGGIEVNKAHPLVRCYSNIYLFGPDGYRYHCVHKLIQGDKRFRFEHISEDDLPIETEVECDQFGLCAGCDNNIEGMVEDAS